MPQLQTRAILQCVRKRERGRQSGQSQTKAEKDANAEKNENELYKVN